MSAYKSDFLNVLADRGFIHQVSEPEALDALARTSTITGYIGFDCTAPSLHIGSLLPIMLLYWLQQTGHKADRADGRRHHTRRRSVRQGREPPAPHRRGHQRAQQGKASAQVFSKFLKFARASGNAVMANNAEWLTKLNYIDFLRDIGRHFSVNRMLAMDSVKLRLEREQE
jgi:tyrosyl-tRNA synthetase